MSSVFAYFDGDNIGSRLELLLLDNDVITAEAYSASVATALVEACKALASLPTARVIFAGGDDIFAQWDASTIGAEDVERVRAAYQSVCGQSLSVGIGHTSMQASLNLRRAKLLGKSQVVSEPRGPDDSQN